MTTKLSKEKRQIIYDFMREEYRKKHLPDEKLKAKLFITVNKILRRKYPENDMEVLRKYKLTRRDRCIKFTVTETQRFFGLTLQHNDIQGDVLADIPVQGGCISSEAFACSEKEANIIGDWLNSEERRIQKQNEDFSKFSSFLSICKTVEEVEKTVPLPEALRSRLGSSLNSVVAINPDILKEIKKQFSGV